MTVSALSLYAAAYASVMLALSLTTFALVCHDQELIGSVTFVLGVQAVASTAGASVVPSMKVLEKKWPVVDPVWCLSQTWDQSSPGVPASTTALPSSWNRLGLGPPS